MTLACASVAFLAFVLLIGAGPFFTLLIIGPKRAARWLNHRSCNRRKGGVNRVR